VLPTLTWLRSRSAALRPMGGRRADLAARSRCACDFLGEDQRSLMVGGFKKAPRTHTVGLQLVRSCLGQRATGALGLAKSRGGRLSCDGAGGASASHCQSMLVSSRPAYRKPKSYGGGSVRRAKSATAGRGSTILTASPTCPCCRGGSLSRSIPRRTPRGGDCHARRRGGNAAA